MVASRALLFCRCHCLPGQLLYQWKRKNLPGPAFVVPLIGSIVQMVLGPYEFWHKHFNIPGLSWNALLVSHAPTVGPSCAGNQSGCGSELTGDYPSVCLLSPTPVRLCAGQVYGDLV
jgi:hypothetical protein